MTTIWESVAQPGLRPGRYLTIQERFDEWMRTAEGQLVYGELLRRSALLIHRGWKHYSHKAIIETIRYDQSVRLGAASGGFRINDHYSSRLARKAMRENAYLRDFYEVRELRA